MQRALFTIICVTLFLATSSTSIAQTPAPAVPAAKALGTGPWADGFKHVVQDTNVGRGCLEITNFQIVSGKALYACLTLEDQRYHVVHDVKMEETGYSRIGGLEITKAGEIAYVGYEGRKHCNINSKGTNCSEGPIYSSVPDSLSYTPPGTPRHDTPPPSLPTSLTGGKTITQYWSVNNQPLWVDCDSEKQGTSGTNCRMRWNGHSQGKDYYHIWWVIVSNNQVAYKAQATNDSAWKVVWGSSEGEAYQSIDELEILGNQPVYVAKHANSLTYVVKGRQKEAFRSVSNFQIVEDKIFFVGQKDSAAMPSPI